jgi:hypothetical protein
VEGVEFRGSDVLELLWLQSSVVRFSRISFPTVKKIRAAGAGTWTRFLGPPPRMGMKHLHDTLKPADVTATRVLFPFSFFLFFFGRLLNSRCSAPVAEIQGLGTAFASSSTGSGRITGWIMTSCHQLRSNGPLPSAESRTPRGREEEASSDYTERGPCGERRRCRDQVIERSRAQVIEEGFYRSETRNGLTCIPSIEANAGRSHIVATHVLSRSREPRRATEWYVPRMATRVRFGDRVRG